jgi:hypothetical protein
VVSTGTVVMTGKAMTSALKKSSGTPRNGERNAAEPRSEGHRLLAQVSDSLGVVARAAGAGKTSAHRWLSGGAPDEAARRNLYAAYGIPVESWDQPPLGGAAIEAEGDSAQVAGHTVEPPKSSYAHFMLLIGGIELIKPKLSPSEQRRAIRDVAAIRALADRALAAERADMQRLVRDHPGWQRFEDAVAEALEPYPDAKRAVAELLEKRGL